MKINYFLLLSLIIPSCMNNQLLGARPDIIIKLSSNHEFVILHHLCEAFRAKDLDKVTEILSKFPNIKQDTALLVKQKSTKILKELIYDLPSTLKKENCFISYEEFIKNYDLTLKEIHKATLIRNRMAVVLKMLKANHKRIVL